MHELSIVMSIIDIASQEAQKVNASIIEEIELEIGMLSSIEMDAFDFAWQQAVKNTALTTAVRVIKRPEGKAVCLDCYNEFTIENVYDSCPACNSYIIDIIQGKELKVKSLVI